MLVNRIDDMLNKNRTSIYEENSVDFDTYNMIEEMSAAQSIAVEDKEEEKIFQETRALFAQLKE